MSADIPQEELEPAVRKKVGRRGKIAIAFSSAVMGILLLSFIYWALFGSLSSCACVSTNIALIKAVSEDGKDWVITVTSVQGIASKSDLTFRVMSTNGNAIAGTTKVMSSWTNDIGLIFVPVTLSATTLVVGDYWTLARTTFTVGMQVQLLTANQVIGQVTL